VLADMDLDLELVPDAPVATLTMAERQLFEVAKALVNEPKVLLLDEPTTALGPGEVEALHRAVVACKRRGVGVVYVSHRLPEVLEVADRITVLRDGHLQGTFDAATTTEPQLVERIVGRPFEAAFPVRVPPSSEAEIVLAVDALRGQTFGPVSFTLHSGEVVGIAGAEGNGQPELFNCLAGRVPPRAGRVVRRGKELTLISTHEAVGAGIMLLPGDRKREALMGVLGVRVNASVQSLRRFCTFGLLRRRAERAAVQSLIDQLEIRTPWLDQPVEFLSGGNQQKVSVAKWIAAGVKLLIIDEPTVGIDIKTKAYLHDLIHELAEQGTAILLITSDMPEMVDVADHILVMSGFAIKGEVENDRNYERVSQAIMGFIHSSAAA
jgi:ribose transport system ATP-binding protein